MPLLKVSPVSSGAWILPSSNALHPRPVWGRRRGRHPFAPLQGRVFWPWPLHPALGLSFACLCSALQALQMGFILKLKIRKQHSADSLWNFSLWHCPIAIKCTFLSSSQAFRVCWFDSWLSPEDSRFCLLWWLDCDGCIPTSLECSIRNYCTALSKEAAGYLWALCCCSTLVQDWSRLTCISDVHSNKQ